MKVLLVAHHLPPRHLAGTEVYTARLADALGERHQVTVFATDDDPSLEPGSIRRRRERRYDVIELAEPRLVRSPDDSWKSVRAESAFANVLGEIRPDVCHFQHLRYTSMTLPVIAKRGRVPTLLTMHDYWLMCPRDGQLVDREGARCSGPSPDKCTACLADYRFGLSAAELAVARFVAGVRRRLGVDLGGMARRAGLAARTFGRKSARMKSLPLERAAGMLDMIEARRAAAKSVLSSVDVVIAPSKFLRGVYKDAGFARGRWVVVGHGADGPAAGRPAPTAKGSGPLRIGFAGTVTPLKGVDVLIDAARLLPAGSFSLDVHGRDDLRPEYSVPLKQRARGLPIRFHGGFAPESAGGFMQDWDVAVVPSRWVENQPLAILEAFACGVPVVASDLGGMRELVQDGVNGRLFPVEDSRGLAAVLTELGRDREHLARLRSGVTPPPSMARHAERIEALYEQAVAS
jgi:glycosyltransferase involved in cell wall biosynthesis